MRHDEISCGPGRRPLRGRLRATGAARGRLAARAGAVPSRLRSAHGSATARVERRGARAAAPATGRLQAGSEQETHDRRIDDPMKFKAMLAASALLAGAASLSAQTLPPPQNV